METKSLETYLNNFGQKVVDDAKANLQSDKGSTAVGRSIRFEVVPTDTGFSTKFYMLDYGEFLDKGVSGNKKKRSFENYKGQTQSSLSFFQQPFGIEYEKLNEEILTELKLDIETYITTFYRPK